MVGGIVLRIEGPKLGRVNTWWSRSAAADAVNPERLHPPNL